MYCNKCGAPIEPSYRFCRGCGTALSAAEKPPQNPKKGLLILLMCVGIVALIAVASQNNDGDQKQVSSPVPIASRNASGDGLAELGAKREPAYAVTDQRPVGGGGYVDPDSLTWHTVMAHDATFQLALPNGWQETGPQILENFLALSEQGESFGSGIAEVFANTEAKRLILPGYKAVLPPEQSELMSRLLAPPLDPVQVVTQLFPQVSGGAMQNVRVVEAHPIPSAPGTTAALIHYQFILFPRRDAAFASGLPPELLSMDEVPMEAMGVISTNPGNGATWTLTYGTISAPQSIFASNQRVYAAIYRSYQFIAQGLVAKTKNYEAAANLAAEMNKTTREVAHRWELRLGDQVESGGTPDDPAPRRTFPDPGPCPGGTLYRCGEQRLVCLDAPPPANSDCHPNVGTPQ